MVTKQKDLELGVDFSTLGIGQDIETDRFELDERGAMQITRFRIDIRTQYYQKDNPDKRGILKFDGFDIATGERIKYRTTSSVIINNFDALLDKVRGAEQQDENGNIWTIFKTPINITGFVKVKSAIKGHNPYLKIV